MTERWSGKGGKSRETRVVRNGCIMDMGAVFGMYRKDNKLSIELVKIHCILETSITVYLLSRAVGNILFLIYSN